MRTSPRDILVTIVMVQRERFSFTRRSLERLLEDRSVPFHLVCVDGGSPAPVRRYLEQKAEEQGFTLIRRPHYLAQNQARNFGFEQVRTKYVLFMDNDVLVTPGWLEALVQCAEETGAAIVGPVYCEGEPEGQTVHMAGGIAHYEVKDGRSRFIERHRHAGARLDVIRPALTRGPCELVEFHCMLVRSDSLRQVGPLDERLLSTPEHLDLCLLVREAGGSVYFEPAAMVTYVPPGAFAWSDARFVMLRWSERWNRESMKHFQAKWKLADDDPFVVKHSEFLRKHRRDYSAGWTKLLRQVLGWRLGTWAAERSELWMNEVIAAIWGRHQCTRKPTSSC